MRQQPPPVHQCPSTHIKVDGKNLNYVRSFTYLGSKVNYNASLDDVIINRIAKATTAFGKLRHRLWNERGIKLDTKIQVYKAVVLPTLLYGSEFWTPYRTHTNQLDTFHKGCLRTICGYTPEDKISNVDLFTKCIIGSTETFLMQSQLRWAGHVIRMSDDRIPNVLMYSQLDSGKRDVGRPWLRYKDKLKSNLTAVNVPLSTFKQVALDRKDGEADVMMEFEISKPVVLSDCNKQGQGQKQHWQCLQHLPEI